MNDEEIVKAIRSNKTVEVYFDDSKLVAALESIAISLDNIARALENH